MKAKSNQPSPAAFVDPDRVPGQLVDQRTVHGMKGSLLDITSCTAVASTDHQTEIRTENVVAARFRFDLKLA